MKETTQHRYQSRRGHNDFKQYLRFEKLFGYVHEVRAIPQSKPQAYAAKIAVPQGQGQRIQYLTFELYVKSAEALVLLLDQMDAIDDDDTKVTVRFSCNTLYPKAYIGQRGKYEGEIVSYFSGNLSHLFSMKVDGEIVYGDRQRGSENTENDEEMGGPVTEVIPVEAYESAQSQLDSGDSDSEQARGSFVGGGTSHPQSNNLRRSA